MKKLFAFAIAVVFVGGVAFAATTEEPKKDAAKTTEEAKKPEEAKKHVAKKEAAKKDAKKAPKAEATPKPEEKK
jgi:hypothetical protein